MPQLRFSFIALLLSLFFAPASLAQKFGGHPPSQKWKQINTDTLRLIFPESLKEKAMQIAGLLHWVPAKTNATIGNRLSKINIVLQNQTVVSNGYVGMGPYRSELFTTPYQNSFYFGSIPWHLSLALHEYRHVQQYNNFNTGVARIAYHTFGQEGGALLNNIAVPNWFWEGDAVFQETFLSQQGRGRLPFFFNDFRGLWMAGKDYSWMKLRNGSLRDFVPDHYRLGYLLVAYGREKYGDSIWQNITHDAARFKGVFYPFQKSVKRYTGVPYQRFTKDALEHFKSFSPGLQKNANGESSKHFIGDEEFPQWINSDSIIVLKSSYKHRPLFVIKDVTNSKEKIIGIQDIVADNYFSYRNGKITYSAYEPDIRWGWRDYNVIKVLDIESGEQIRLTNRGKYFSPDIDADGKRVIAVSVEADGTNALHILEVPSGKLVNSLPNKDDVYYTYPKFYGSSHIVSAVRNNENKMAICKTNVVDGSYTYLTPFSENPIAYLQVINDTILFNSSYKSVDRIFTIENDQIYLYSSPKMSPATGNYYPSLTNGKLAWSDFTSTGYQLKMAEAHEVELIPIDNNLFAQQTIAYELDALKQGEDLVSQPIKTQYQVSKYSKSFRLINFHSIRPFISDPEYTFSLVSENILNTFQSELFFTYNRNEGSKQIGVSGIYGGLFPWIRLGVDYTIDRNARYGNQRVYWDELQPRVGVSIPLNITSGRYYRSFSVGADYVFNKQMFRGNFKDSFETEQFSYINSSIQWSSQVQKARMHIYPRFAQTLFVNWRKAIINSGSQQFLVSAGLYLPGVTLTHNLHLQAAIHNRSSGQRIFSNNFPFSRGYSAENFRDMMRFGVNYHFPLLYPDRGIANIVYFLRVRGNTFFDYTRASDELLGSERLFRSVGGEIYFDTKWWNQHPVSFGVRYSRLLDDDIDGRMNNQWEFILPVNLFNR